MKHAMNGGRLALAMMLVLATGACGKGEGSAQQAVGTVEPANVAASGDQAQATAGPVAAVANAGPAALAPCKVCHTFEKDGANGIGPNLYGVFGHPAAGKPAYAYSTALKASGISWDAAALDAFLMKPQQKVPGTKMPFPGEPDAAKRRQIIEFLKGLGS